jgi:hypothetical protein
MRKRSGKLEDVQARIAELAARVRPAPKPKPRKPKPKPRKRETVWQRMRDAREVERELEARIAKRDAERAERAIFDRYASTLRFLAKAPRGSGVLQSAETARELERLGVVWRRSDFLVELTPKGNDVARRYLANT